MLRSVKELQGTTIHGTDGDIGKLDDFFFDDDAWTIRYLVVDASDWIKGRKILVSPVAVRNVDVDQSRIEVSLDRDQIKNSPDVDTAQPVSRMKEETLLRYYDWPIYWGVGEPGTEAGMPGPLLGSENAEPSPADLTPEEERSTNPSVPIEQPASNDSHVRSTREVIGYTIQARDGDIGRIQDLLPDDRTWRINYLVIDTSTLWFGKKVILPPTWVQRVSWAERKAIVDLKRETVKNSPEFDSETITNQA